VGAYECFITKLESLLFLQCRTGPSYFMTKSLAADHLRIHVSCLLLQHMVSLPTLKVPLTLILNPKLDAVRYTLNVCDGCVVIACTMAFLLYVFGCSPILRTHQHYYLPCNSAVLLRCCPSVATADYSTPCRDCGLLG
jgi:hypothetical protein